MKKLNQKAFTVLAGLLIFITVVLICGTGYYVFNKVQNDNSDKPSGDRSIKIKKEDDSTPEPKALKAGDFGDNGEYGTLQAEGYVSQQKVDEAFCEENCTKYDYVFFNITKTENTHIFDYLKSISGNSYVGAKAVGVGCLAGGKIIYSNASDANGMKEYSISKVDTTKIMASTEEKPVRLQLERLKFSSGSGAPTCYSHFTTFTVIE